jgi:hypothetical protein
MSLRDSSSFHEAPTTSPFRMKEMDLLRSLLFPVPVQSPIWVWGGIGTGRKDNVVCFCFFFYFFLFLFSPLPCP